jgi:transposase
MEAEQVLVLGLGVAPPWRLVSQNLETEKRPHELHLRLEADRGALYSCPDCDRACKAHDFAEFRWRHLNFFQHHCYITARVPRTDCLEHGVKRVRVPWAREGSGFTLLFEQVALALVREMPVQAAARHMEVTDHRLWRVISHYVGRALERLDLADVRAVGFDETASKRGHNYVTIFIDLDRQSRPVLFATPGKGKETVRRFKDFLLAHKGKPGRIAEVVCDMSPAFLAAMGETFPEAAVTVDWFHVVQLFTKAVDDVRKAEGRLVKMPSATRWAVLKAKGRNLTEKQAAALAELEAGDFLTAEAWRIKEKLRWVRVAETVQAAKWRLSHFLRYAREKVALAPLLAPVLTAIETVGKHSERILQRWASTHSNARMEAFNGIFKAARARARGYRNVQTFITMIYLIAAPLGDLFKSI